MFPDLSLLLGYANVEENNVLVVGATHLYVAHQNVTLQVSVLVEFQGGSISPASGESSTGEVSVDVLRLLNELIIKGYPDLQSDVVVWLALPRTGNYHSYAD